VRDPVGAYFAANRMDTLDREVGRAHQAARWFGADRGGQPVHAKAWRLRKARTLVKLLALTRDQRLHRDVLLDALRPGRDPISAVNNLHQVLHVAHRVLAGDGPSNGVLEFRDAVRLSSTRSTRTPARCGNSTEINSTSDTRRDHHRNIKSLRSINQSRNVCLSR
jgi:hypothetical protein